MPITQGLCTSFRQELGQAIHNLATDDIKIALYTNAANLGTATTAYTASGETSGTGYTAGGRSLTGKTWTVDNGIAIFDATDAAWAAATFTARGALIYNASKANRAIAVLSFGTDITATNGDFTVEFPAPAAATALVRI